MTTQLDFKVPSWVPKVVVREADSQVPHLHAGLRLPFDEKARKVLRRLLTDKRMRWVWKELTKQRRHPRTYKPVGSFYPQEQAPVRFLDMTIRQNSLSSFFISAYLNAVQPAEVMTKDEVIDARARLNNTAKRLEKLAGELRHWNSDLNVSGQFATHLWAHSVPTGQALYVPANLRFSHPWTDLNQVADELGKLALFFDHLTGEHIGNPIMVVERKTRRDQIRAYVLGLSRSCKRIFGSPLYGIVAAVASVVLGKRISAENVRKICS